MVSLPFLVAFVALFTSLTALELYSSLGLDNKLLLVVGPMAWAEAVRALLPAAAMGALLAAVTSIYYRRRHGAGGGTELAVGVMCAAAGVIESSCFVGPAARVDAGARARQIGAAAAHLLPAAATATFFLGLALVFLHARAGGGALAGEGPVQIVVRVVLGATAVLAGLMALAL